MNFVCRHSYLQFKSFHFNICALMRIIRYQNRRIMSAKIDWKDSFVQLIIVTLGILIAFALNSWNETRKEKKLSQLYLDGLKEELLLNKKELEAKLEYHTNILKGLDEDPLKVRMQLRPPNLTNSAWKLSENDVFKQNVDKTLYKNLVEAYQIHGILDHHSSIASENMTQLNLKTPLYLLSRGDAELTEEDSKDFATLVGKGWIPVFQDWVGYEYAYIAKIDSCLQLMDNK